jgi:hypothetical protein
MTEAELESKVINLLERIETLEVGHRSLEEALVNQSTKTALRLSAVEGRPVPGSLAPKETVVPEDALKNIKWPTPNPVPLNPQPAIKKPDESVNTRIQVMNPQDPKKRKVATAEAPAPKFM